MHAFSNASTANMKEEEHLRCKEAGNAQSQKPRYDWGDGRRYYYAPRFGPATNGSYFGKEHRIPGSLEQNGDPLSGIPGVWGI